MQPNSSRTTLAWCLLMLKIYEPCGPEPKAKELLLAAMPFLRKEFSLPKKDLHVYLAPLYQESEKEIELGYVTSERIGIEGSISVVINTSRAAGSRMLETIAHEFVHVEQVHQCRLAVYEKVRHWQAPHGIERYGPPTSFKEYQNLPWEIEARERGKLFSNKYKYDILKPHQLSTVERLVRLWRKIWN